MELLTEAPDEVKQLLELALQIPEHCFLQSENSAEEYSVALQETNTLK